MAAKSDKEKKSTSKVSGPAKGSDSKPSSKPKKKEEEDDEDDLDSIKREIMKTLSKLEQAEVE